MIQSCGFVTDKARNLPDSAFGSYHKQKIAKLQSYIIARRKLDLCSGDAGYAIHPPGEVENAILLNSRHYSYRKTVPRERLSRCDGGS